MYRPIDIEAINKNIDIIKGNAAEEYKKKFEPTLLENSQVYYAIKNFIIKTNRIVYGGLAQHLLLELKNKDEIFYKQIDEAYYNWPDLADIEFYSPSPLEDIINLTEELYTLGFKYIEGKEGVHAETFKIFVNFINYCDISYIPKNIYNRLPTITINGLRCAIPHFMLVDAYRVITDPLTSYWRLEKSISRFNKIMTYYPLNKKLLDKNIIFNNENNNVKILQFIKKKIIKNTNLIIVGFYAYNYYIKKVSHTNIIKNYLYYEIISENLINDGKKIYFILKNKFKYITMKHYYPFFTFFDNKIEYYYNNNLILILYGNNNRCIVYNYSHKKNIKYGTFNLILLYLLFNYFYYLINNKNDIAYNYNILLTKLFYLRTKFLDKHNITVLDNSPFQDFTYKCIGKTIEPLRYSHLQNYMKAQKKKLIKFKYSPSGKKKVKSIKYNFLNTSGNQIINKKNLLF